MIPLDRGDEPPELSSIRMQELERVGQIARTVAPSGEVIGDRYRHGSVLDALWSRQNRKCCFCEYFEQKEFSDIEHYRPKARVRHSRDTPERPGYWWLAWTWSNLMFACPPCNRTFKRTWFPLDGSSTPLEPGQEPPGRELPLLINPFEENPVDFIRFVPLGAQALWTAVAREGHPKGAWTIELLGLNRATLRDSYQEHVAHIVEPHRLTIQAALNGNDPAVIAETWRRETKRLLDHRQPFVALSYDVIDATFPEAVRAGHGLVLRRPGAGAGDAGIGVGG